MIEALLPAAVVSHECVGESGIGELLDEEKPLVERAVDTRKQEFTTGRECARRALAELGIASAPLLSGPKREPLWPDGIRGSITHTRGYVAAAVARAAEVPVLGIDAEPHDSLPDGVLDVVSLPEERAWLAEQETDQHWDRMLFSAKESVYKAWYPLTGKWLGFEDAMVTFSPQQASFTVGLLVPPEPTAIGRITGFHGRFHFADTLILTAVTTPIIG